MKKRTAVRLISYCLAAVLVMGGFTWRAGAEKADYRRYVEAGWRRSFSALASDMTQIDTALRKCLTASSPALSGHCCAEIYARAQEAQTNLGELPFSDYLLEDTAGFLGRLGDYARALALSAYRGSMTETDRQTLAALSETTGVLSQNLVQLQADLDQGLLTVGQLAGADKALEGGAEASGAEGSGTEQSAAPSLGQSIADIEDQFPELPTLIYDGPYSQSVTQGQPKLLEGLENVGEEEAIAAAAHFTGLPERDFTVMGRGEGALPVYILHAAFGEGGEGAEGGEVTLRVTRQGGRVLDMVSSGGSYYDGISEEEAVEKARAFLADREFPSMRDSYWTREDGTLLVSFAYEQDGVLCYPDLVKLRVTLDTGRVTGFDGTGYIMNHTERDIPEAVSEEEARSAVSPALTPLGHRMAVIPTEGKQERFCHEFLCEDRNGGRCLVYVNAETGREEKILLLLEDESGTLAV